MSKKEWIQCIAVIVGMAVGMFTIVFGGAYLVSKTQWVRNEVLQGIAAILFFIASMIELIEKILKKRRVHWLEKLSNAAVVVSFAAVIIMLGGHWA